MKNFEGNYNRQHYSLVKLTQVVKFSIKKYADRDRSKNRNSYQKPKMLPAAVIVLVVARLLHPHRLEPILKDQNQSIQDT